MSDRIEQVSGADRAQGPSFAKPSASPGPFTTASPGFFVAVYFFFALTCMWIYRAALQGPFISDDVFYIVSLGKRTALDASLIWEAFDPSSEWKFAIANYAPLTLLVNRLEWALFAEDTTGYHVVNIAVHALNATLLVILLTRSRIPVFWALLGGALFAFHPANVETVAWISQLRSLLAFAAVLASLLVIGHSVWLGALFFACGLLFKVSALLGLPVLATLWWVGRSASHGRSVSGQTVLLWAAIFIAYAIPQFQGFDEMGHAESVGYEDFFTHFRSVMVIGVRYLVMATTTKGLSGFHEPEPVTSWSDPEWWVALPILVALGWRFVVTLRNRSVEAAWWLSAAAGFGPISQIFPFYFGMGDRYLYFILPGLIGGGLLLWGNLFEAVRERWRDGEAGARWGTRIDHALRVLLAVSVVVFALRAQGRAPLWQHEDALLLEAAMKYPKGGVAHYVRSVKAIQRDDLETAMIEIRAAVERGYYLNRDLLGDPRLAGLRRSSDYAGFHEDLVRRGLAHLRSRRHVDQATQRSIAGSLFLLGEYDEAERVIEDALRMEGHHRKGLLEDLQVIREKRAATRGANR